MKTSLKPQEIAHFARDAAQWWDENGPFRPLHRLGPLRLRYIRDQITAHYGLLKGLRVLDIGCGGGLVSEPLARLGAQVTGIDADAVAIDAAKAHAAGGGLAIDYKVTTAEELLVNIASREEENGFDVVLALEIIEHVADREFFVRTCAELCKPGGLVIFSTLNRTPQSFALGIVAAEYLLGWVPRGTHNWKQFVRPAELARDARASGLLEKNLQGYGFDVPRNEFAFVNNVRVNYFMSLAKGEK